MDDPKPIQWYYAENGEQRGPFTAAELEDLVSRGTVTGSTLVWHAGMTGWTPWSQAGSPPEPAPPPLDGPPAELPANRVRCSECGLEFPTEDTIPHGTRRICAACKPLFLQRLSEGATLGHTGGPTLSLSEIAGREYPLGVMRSWDRGWEAFRQEPWRLMAATLIFAGLLTVLGSVGFVAGLVVPLAANILGLFVTSQLTAGIYLIFLRRLRGERVNLQDGFRGFGPCYWQLTLYQLIQSGVMLGFALLLGIGLAPGIILGASASAGTVNPPMAAVIALFVLGALVSITAIVLLFYFLVSWMFVAPLILDKGLDAWPAMKLCRKVVNRHPFRFSVVILVLTTFGMVGALACGVGLIVTGTLAGLMLASVYEDMFGPLDPRTSR